MSIEVLKTDMVLLGYQLLETEADRKQFKDRIEAEVIEGSMPPGLTLELQAPGRTFNLVPRNLRIEKERIAITVTPDRTVISMDYPQADDLPRLCDVAVEAIIISDSTDQPLQALGFNINLLHDLPAERAAGEFIAGRILIPEYMHQSDFQPRSGSLTIISTKEAQAWTVSLEPRFGDATSRKVYMTVNLHYDEPAFDQPMLRSSFQELWSEAHHIAEGFVGNRTG